MTPFDFVNAINFTKQNLFEDSLAAKDYSPFLVNRALSYFPDTVLYANEMNRQPHVEKQMQFDFLLHSIPKRKRFSKWVKKETSTDDLTAVQMFYKYSAEKALDVMSILSPEQINSIKRQMDKGGTS